MRWPVAAPVRCVTHELVGRGRDRRAVGRGAAPPPPGHHHRRRRARSGSRRPAPLQPWRRWTPTLWRLWSAFLPGAATPGMSASATLRRGNPTPPALLGPLTVVFPSAQLCPVTHTKHLRPPPAYTDALKRAQMRVYGAPAPRQPSSKTTSSHSRSVGHHATRKTSGRSRMRHQTRKTP